MNQESVRSSTFEKLFKKLKNDEKMFFNYFRMSIESFEKLLNLLENSSLPKCNTNMRKCITTKMKLATCLRFLITGSIFKSLGYSYRMGFSTVRSIVHETCQVIWNVLRPSIMPKPTREKWTRIAMEFDEKWNFPNCIGAIDGKHFRIRAPRNSGSIYMNYKKFFSIVLLAVVDANYKFVIADVGSYGRNSDGGIMQNSIFGKKLTSNALNVPPKKRLPRTDLELPYVFIADEAFPLTTNIMRPFSSDRLTDEEQKRVFNYRLSRARRFIECTFGIFANKWRIFHRPLNVDVEFAVDIIKAACVLHNYVKQRDGNKFEDTFEGLPNSIIETTQNVRRGGPMLTTVREEFANYFVSEEGKLDWQWNII
ncbi:unnamed protein product [Plutella xylostella]|uniref:(diamondback moth) hypothetical protein n=1 Tax=Plutella xylostella TaxID=51655 RepID=A0A8S4F8J1_PLUXY|nr:unnamed protein product [Plutella xylostella]